jgi:hypothetical protein
VPEATVLVRLRHLKPSVVLWPLPSRAHEPLLLNPLLPGSSARAAADVLDAKYCAATCPSPLIRASLPASSSHRRSSSSRFSNRCLRLALPAVWTSTSTCLARTGPATSLLLRLPREPARWCSCSVPHNAAGTRVLLLNHPAWPFCCASRSSSCSRVAVAPLPHSHHDFAHLLVSCLARDNQSDVSPRPPAPLQVRHQHRSWNLKFFFLNSKTKYRPSNQVLLHGSEDRDLGFILSLSNPATILVPIP